MKKSFLSILLISFLLLLVSCGNLFNQNNETSGEGTLVLNLRNSYARTVSPLPEGHYFSDITEWYVKVEDVTNVHNVFETTKELSVDHTLDVKIPLGSTYSVTVTGTLTVDEKDFVYTGKIDAITFGDATAVTKTVFVELSKSDHGSLECTFNLPDEVKGKRYKMKLLAPNTETGVTYYSSASTPGLTYSDGTLKYNTGATYSESSGYYLLQLFYTNDTGDGEGVGVWYPLTLDGDTLVEIADEHKTTVTYSVRNVVTQIYYATTETSSYNGLTPSYPINIKTLFEKIEDDAIQAEEVKIYLPEGTNLKTNNIVVPMVSGSLKLYVYIGNGLFYNGDAGYVSEVYVSEEGNDNGTGQPASPLATFGAAWDFVNLYAGTESDITIHGDGSVAINEANRCEISRVKSLTIIGDSPDLGSVIQGKPYGRYHSNGNGLCFSNVETINIENVAIRTILGGDGSSSSQCAGLRFDGTSSIKNVTIDGCTFYRNEEGSVGESILFIGGTATPINVSIKNCNFEENGEAGDPTAGVLKVLDANVNMTVDTCIFKNNYKADLYISANQSHDFEPTVTVKSSKFKRTDANANIVYEAGKLNLEGTVTDGGYIVSVGDGRTVNVSNNISGDDKIMLDPENYAQSAPILSVSEGLVFNEQMIGQFDLYAGGYTINSDGYIEGDYLKHITPTNYESFTKDDLAEDMTLVIHSGVPSDKLRDFFMGLDNSANSESPITITIDLSGYDSDLETSGPAYLFDSINVICVILPDNMTSINDQLFESANTLREIKIAASNSNYVTENGILYKKNGNEKTEIIKYPQAKEGESFTLPETVTAAAYGAFEQTINLKTIPNFNIITELNGMNILKYSSVTSLVLNDSITIIPYYTFEESKIENITLPANLISIGANSFCYCSQLRTVTFRNANPPEMTEANDLTEFAECPNLEQINVPGTDLSVVSAYQAALPEAVRSKVALYLPTGDSINVTEALTDGFIITPESYDYAYPIITFADGVDPTTNLEKIHLSDSTYHIDETGRIASALRKTVTFANWKSEFGSWSELPEDMTLVIDSSMAKDVEVAEDVTIPVATEFFNTLENNSKDLTLDLSSYRADSYSELSFMNSAVKVILPDTLEDLYSNAFESERQLKEIVISESNPNYVTIDGVLYKKDASGNPSVLVRYPPNRDGESFTLPSTVTSIGQAAFANATSLEYVTNFNQITECEVDSQDHFRGSAVSSIELGENLTELGTAMFRECRYISSITIPAGVAKINANCFESCSNLTSITFMGSVPPFIGNDAFLGCEGLTYIYVPASAVGDYKDVLPEELKEYVIAN